MPLAFLSPGFTSLGFSKTEIIPNVKDVVNILLNKMGMKNISNWKAGP